MLCRRTHNRNRDVPALKADNHDNSLKILYQAGIELGRQATSIAKRYTLTTFLTIMHLAIS